MVNEYADLLQGYRPVRVVEFLKYVTYPVLGYLRWIMRLDELTAFVWKYSTICIGRNYFNFSSTKVCGNQYGVV